MSEPTDDEERTKGTEPSPPLPPKEVLVIDLTLTGLQLGAGTAMAGTLGEEGTFDR